ncbi:hypothetical protein [Aquabacterium sp.]|uniref:hypothetical protein n=1 Tax=Aquabacterium sp. TaxID=1872578 RepID=UPI0024891259|nr:hypothetical protein [Aquabacterium sp.]MDI1261583.1 hypothetical protein [Aquabacterium sp.]
MGILSSGLRRLVASSMVLAVFGFGSAWAAVPIVLYDRPLDDPWWDLTDNSGLTKLTLTNVLVDQSTPWSLKWDITNPSTQSPNLYEIELSWTKGYTKSFAQTSNAEVNGELTAEFKGIGAKIGGSYSTGFEIKEEATSTTEEKLKTSCTLGCLQNGKYYTKSIFDQFSGTYEWFDDVGPHVGGETRLGNWTAIVYHGHGIDGPKITGGIACVPETSASLLALAGVGFMGAWRMAPIRSRRRERQQA